MNIKRLVLILIGVILVSFGIGIYSFKYNDKVNFINYINNNSNGNINIESKDGIVNIDKSGIKVLDGDNRVSIGWDGINISDGDDHFSLGWNGINITEGNKSIFRFGNRRNPFGFTSAKLISHSVNEEIFEDITGVDNISISSLFINTKVTPEDREDVRIHYHGNMKSNVFPKLMLVKNNNDIIIKLESPSINSQVITSSDMVLEVFIPKSFKGNFNTTTSSGDIDLENLVGENFDITTSSGDLEIENIEGEFLNLTSSSGEVEIEDSVGEMNISTSSGDVKLKNRETSKDIKISTSSGNVEIQLSEDSNYKIKGSSSSGRYTSNLDMNIEENEKGSFKATIGSGEKTIDIKTSSGDVKFNER